MYHVTWSSFTWEAFATILAGALAFAAGVIAVIGAVKVGSSQTDLLAKQAAIAERQVALSELTLRAELFQDRVKVYDGVRSWLRFIVMHGRAPGMARPNDGIHEVPGENALNDQFIDAWDRSRFLFRPAVFQELERLRVQSHDLRLQQVMQIAPADPVGREHRIERELEHMLNFGDTAQRLSTIFGDELNLSMHHTVHGPLPTEDAE